ncbi:MAG: response regulator [Lachnospiraceae bacterium]|nr:response regulator [Lachnospiraceae bacterium]
MINKPNNDRLKFHIIFIILGTIMAIISLALHFSVVVIKDPPEILGFFSAGFMTLTLVLGIVSGIVMLCRFHVSANTLNEKEAEIERIREESERALAEAKAKSDFLVNMSHEIRTPMNAISCATELLIKENHSESEASYLGILKSSSENLLDVVNDILDFSKIDAGKMILSENEYEIGTLIEDVKNIISVRLAAKPIAFTIDVDPTIPKVLIGDEVRIRQILINLLGNAVKFTTKGLVSLTVSYERLSKESIDVSFAVRDTGTGIAPSDKEKIFQKFGQAGRNRKAGTEGTGLGLTICRELTSMMGGSINFTSELGKGSTFTARVRQRVTPDNTPIVDTEMNRNMAMDCLVWDENIHYADNIERILKALGVSVRRVFRESEAEGILSTVKVDYFLVNAGMFKNAGDMVARMSPTTIPVKILDIGEADTVDYLSRYPVLRKPLDIFTIMALLKSNSDRSRFAMDRDAKFVTPEANIMIVDDNRVNLKVAKALFETFKAKVVDVDSGSEAVELIRSGGEFDLIFMDHMMPGMDGIEASKRIWKIEKEQGRERTPIIALTANAGGELEKMFFEAGMSDFLSKPIVMKHLSFLMQKLLPKDKIVYVHKEEVISGRKHSLSQVSTFSAAEGIANVWDDKNIFISILKVFVSDSPELLDMVGTLSPEKAKPILEQLAAMSRSAGVSRLADLLQEVANVSTMGVSEVYDGLLKNVADEHKLAMTEIQKYLQEEAGPTEDELLTFTAEEFSEHFAELDGE